MTGDIPAAAPTVPAAPRYIVWASHGPEQWRIAAICRTPAEAAAVAAMFTTSQIHPQEGSA